MSSSREELLEGFIRLVIRIGIEGLQQKAVSCLPFCPTRFANVFPGRQLGLLLRLPLSTHHSFLSISFVSMLTLAVPCQTRASTSVALPSSPHSLSPLHLAMIFAAASRCRPAVLWMYSSNSRAALFCPGHKRS